MRAQASREGMAELLALLRDDGESARHLEAEIVCVHARLAAIWREER